MTSSITALPSDAAEILKAGAAIGTPMLPTEGDYAVIPDGYKLESVERFRQRPDRKRAKIYLSDAESFIAYVKKHGSLDFCALYAAVDYVASACTITAIIDDHGSSPDLPQWREHTATYAPRLSEEWKRWTGASKKTMAQSEFATFLEDNLADIASVDGMPTGADMLKLALEFEANSTKRFKRRIDLQTGGAALEFVDEADADTSTKLRLFERFTIGIPVFEFSPSAYPLTARLRFRQQQEKLLFWFELVRPDKAFRAAISEELRLINEKTGMQLLMGSSD